MGQFTFRQKAEELKLELKMRVQVWGKGKPENFNTGQARRFRMMEEMLEDYEAMIAAEEAEEAAEQQDFLEF